MTLFPMDRCGGYPPFAPPMQSLPCCVPAMVLCGLYQLAPLPTSFQLGLNKAITDKITEDENGARDIYFPGFCLPSPWLEGDLTVGVLIPWALLCPQVISGSGLLRHTWA